MGHWKWKQANIRCKETPLLNEDRINWPTYYLTFHEDFTKGQRSILDRGLTINSQFGKWHLESGGKKLFMFPDEGKSSDSKPVKIKKLNEKELKMVVLNEFIGDPTVEGSPPSQVGYSTVVYERVNDLSQVLFLTKLGNYWVENTEVLNAHWCEYEDAQSIKVDSLSSRLANIKKPVDACKHPGEALKPVVMVTYEQALAYCRWKSTYISKLIGQPVTYRLPTLQEWMQIAGELASTKQDELNSEIAESKSRSVTEQDPYHTSASKLDTEEIVHLFDNVSEMTATKGKSVGGNMRQNLTTEENLKKVLSYQDRQYLLGFRCIVEFGE